MELSLMDSYKTSLINSEFNSFEKYQHKLLSNNEEKIITTIRSQLENCDEFIISVAFITESGITLLLEQLRILEEKNIHGKILTGDYLNFTQPKALKKLLSYKNIEIKLLSKEKFHAKGYFFRKGNIWTMIIGSSNLTQTALTTNFEWNLKVTSLENGKLIQDSLEKFNNIFLDLPILTMEDIEKYENLYLSSREFYKKINYENEKILLKDVKPNLMQKEALENLEILRKNEKKGLLISATGTGKTYLGAFDVKKVKPKKFLFLAHRKNILDKSLLTFKSIIDDKKMGIYGECPIDTDYLFAMVQTLNRDEHLSNFSPEYFDYIIVDEVHHGGAKTYQKIINYFKPKFILGMTATPERSDNFDIYKMFDHNIVYEIRLHDALKENLLCPFHYFGISDILVDGKEISEDTTIKDLVVDKRVDHILEKSKYYGYSGEKLHGLIFVSRVEEVYELERKFLERGILSIGLTGKNTNEERENAISKLEKGEISYIISVDIFNEGIDIPCVNQVIFLRPTESSIIYIQQLGRGLRKYNDKDYVVILDFIGNYKNNFLIPTAISQNNSFDKDYMKRFLINGTNMIPGESSIIFEEIVKERIFENINSTNFSTKKNIEHDFNLLEKQLGRIPFLFDFFNRNMIEPNIILKYKKDYDEVLKVLRPKFVENLTKLEKNYLEYLSSFFTPSKRLHEINILKLILEKGKITIEEIEKAIKERYLLNNQKQNIENALKHFTKEIFTSLSTAKTYEPIIKRDNNIFIIEDDFKKSYDKNNYFKKLIDDLINYNLAYVEKNYKQIGEKSILKYKEYTKQQGFWNLNLDFNNGYQVSGYTTFEEEKKVIIFITLDNNNLFDNQFINSGIFTWFSKNNRYLEKKGVKTIEGKIADNYYSIEAFMKKKEGENFYYLGEVERVIEFQQCFNEKEESYIKYTLKLKNEIQKDLFEYFRL
ncbi:MULTISPECIES: DEAD/DEAH box helicase [Fusobacterium]|uniref:DEAD/DEAH box helicase n=1 Tax=Fusobacterium TaxID=848 RepID=UPI001477577B|nr:MULTISPECIES: DEAD/DEAH box helicase [Fusobacterium]NME35230.1 DUF3427 domain-containing protein [Fusobacterium sp. FSA-380-WT-3A]